MTETKDMRKLKHLREQHPSITYRRYTVSPNAVGLTIEFEFELAGGPIFKPRITIPCKNPEIDVVVNSLAFRLGLVELLSYWKTCCPARIIIEAAPLSTDEHPFWLGLLRKGLGEFFFLNNIAPSIDVQLESEEPTLSKHETRTKEPSKQGSQRKQSKLKHSESLVMVGGGKDSITSLELLKTLRASTNAPFHAFTLNPIQSSINAINKANCDSHLTCTRTIDPKLFELNRLDYFNGHTPFSALLAFASSLTAYLNNIQFVFSSNESSASEGNTLYKGFEINHQYSKSLEFETEFRTLLENLAIPVSYASLLRPLNELQICKLFSRSKDYHSLFQSCNRTQTLKAKQVAQEQGRLTDTAWCGLCPKCIFTFLCLACFLETRELAEIFGRLPSETDSFYSTVKDLAGQGEYKPFECVGTFEEVRACLQHLVQISPSPLRNAQGNIEDFENLLTGTDPTLDELLQRWNSNTHLSQHHEALVKQAVTMATETYEKH